MRYILTNRLLYDHDSQAKEDENLNTNDGITPDQT